MSKLKQIVRHSLAGVFVIICILFSVSCSMKEDLTDCVDDGFLLYVKVVDIVTGKDVTDTGILDDVNLYLFDRYGNFVRNYEISASQIAKREPIRIENADPENPVFSAWGNLGEHINVTEAFTGDKLKDLSVSLLQNPEEKEYDISPEDFFFGFKEINRQVNDTRPEEIILTQKNAKLHITVKGLENKDADAYYFKILNRHNGYDFRGIPVERNSSIQQQGIFNGNDDYVSLNPYLLIHSPDPYHTSEENSLRVFLYGKDPVKDYEIVSTNKDITGKYITLSSGKTTNVLISISKNGIVTVYVQVTPWDEVYQWSDY